MHPTSRQRLRHFLQANKSPNLWLQLRGTFSVTDYHIWIHLGSATSVYQKYRKCLCFVTGFLSQLEQGHATCHRGGDVQTRASRWATPRIATDSTLPWHGMAWLQPWLQPKDLSMQTVFRPNCAALMAPAGNSHGGPKPFESFEFQQIGYPCTTEGMDAIQDRFRTNWWQEFLSRIFSHMSLIRSVGTRGKCDKQLCIGVTDTCGADLLRFCLDKWTGMDATSYAAMQWIHLKNSQFGT